MGQSQSNIHSNTNISLPGESVIIHRYTGLMLEHHREFYLVKHNDSRYAALTVSALSLLSSHQTDVIHV